MGRAGWVLTAMVVLFIVGASVAPKFAGAASAVDSFVAPGWSSDRLVLIGSMELVFVVLFAIPRTGFIGAVLMTALLGGAMASHIRVDSPLLSHTLFSIYLGVFMWAALWLRDPEFRAFIKAKAAGPPTS